MSNRTEHSTRKCEENDNFYAIVSLSQESI